MFTTIEVRDDETQAEAKEGYPSSVEGTALVSMEESLRGLQSPV